MENCTLYLKNEPVLLIQYEKNTLAFGNIIEIYNDKLIPIGVNTYPSTKLNNAMQKWWQSRVIPKNRESLDKTEIALLFENTFGFNLSDQYWLKQENSDMTWEKGNFFTNNFNEDIGKYITGTLAKNPDFENMRTDTPDLFSNGEQDKRWVILRNKRYLLKYGRPAYYQQPFNEKLASELCRLLGFNYVDYTFKIKGAKKLQIYSSCKCFIDEHTEYITAGYIQFVLKKDKKTSTFNHLIECCRVLNMPDIETIKKKLYQMILLDYIVANTDRHFGNFGFIRDIDTMEWKGFAPIFDTGNAMFYEYPSHDLKKSRSLMENVESRSFNQTQKEELKKFSTEIALLDIDLSRLKNLPDFYYDILKENPKVEDERRELLRSLLKERIENANRIILTENKYSKEFLKTVKKLSDAGPNLEFCIPKAFSMLPQNSSERKIVTKFLEYLNAKSPKDLAEKVSIFLCK